MSSMLIGIFSNRPAAEDALSSLEQEGFRPQDISIIMKDKTPILTNQREDSGENVVKGAAGGATTGGILGGVAGLLVGIGAIAVPGIGGILVGGPIAALFGLTGVAATTVTGAVTGALAGGLVGSLIGLGIPEHEARQYEERIREGGILLAIPVLPGDELMVRTLLSRHGADMVRVIHSPLDDSPRVKADEGRRYEEERVNTHDDYLMGDYRRDATKTYENDENYKSKVVDSNDDYDEDYKTHEYKTEEVITPRSTRPYTQDQSEPIYYSDIRRNNDFLDEEEENEQHYVAPTQSPSKETLKDKIKRLFR